MEARHSLQEKTIEILEKALASLKQGYAGLPDLAADHVAGSESQYGAL